MIDVELQGPVTVCVLDKAYDSLDTAQVDEFNLRLCEAVDQADHPLFVIDLSHTSFIGSSFLEVLFRVWKRLQQRNGRMVLCGLSDFCREVLHTTRLDTLWNSFDMRQDAVEALLAAAKQSGIAMDKSAQEPKERSS